VAWSSFATGAHPGGHDTLRFHLPPPETSLPISLSRFQKPKNMFLVIFLMNRMAVRGHVRVLNFAPAILKCPGVPGYDAMKGKLLL
jgi:hypothetical protein